MPAPPVITLPGWFDLHVHFRQGPALPAYVQAHLDTGCVGVVAMPNTRPPVSRVVGECRGDGWTIEGYRRQIEEAAGGGFEQLVVPLYLTREATPERIDEGVARGVLRACKYYPPHGTTNAEHGVPMDDLLGGDTLRALEDQGVILCIHGEQHGLAGSDYLDAHASAESRFYREIMPRLRDAHPGLRLVCEHVTTREAVRFVEESEAGVVAASITPQHLLYTLGHLVQGLRYHLYCLPVVKFDADREALRRAVATAGQTRFFAGTDSAPHTTKATDCGCAAGCFTGNCAPQLYATAFEEAGIDPLTPGGRDLLERFLCGNGPGFYGWPRSEARIRLERSPGPVEILETPDGPVTPLPIGMGLEPTWRLA